jgi:hypothetical protein
MKTSQQQQASGVTDHSHSAPKFLSDAEIDALRDISQLQRQVRVEISRNQQAQATVGRHYSILLYY